MARPRIFISSTYFDLKSIREELDRFISSLGYEAIRHEMGHISYGKEEAPENYAYREVEFADILVSIIGSKFGSNSSDGAHSISQVELKKAYQAGKQVYIFIEEEVNAEYKFFLANRHIKDVKYTAVTDIRVYTFIEEIYSLPRGNPIFSFKTGSDVVQLLRDQWAGLFQRLLTQEASRPLGALTEQLQNGLQTVDELVKFLQEGHQQDRSAMQEILLSNHPLFARLRDIVKNKYRIFFINLAELDEWLDSARSFLKVKSEADDDFFIWMREINTNITLRSPSRKVTEYQTLEISKSLFQEDGKLKTPSLGDWKETYVVLHKSSEKPDRFPVDDDDIPF